MFKSDFEKYAISKGISSARLDQFASSVGPSMDYISPTILEERQMNVVGYDVFSRLMVDRIIFLGCEINKDVANIINSQLMYLNSNGTDDVKLFINSPGGSVIDGLSIYDVMNFIEPDVSTYCMGMAASMGSVILSSGTKGKRFALPHAEVMLHQASGGSYGKNIDIQIAAKHIQRLQDELYHILALNTDKSFEEIAEAANNGDNWFMAKDAKNFGLIDNVINKYEE